MLPRWGSVAAALMLGWSGEAMPAPPVNDDCTSPTPITSLPFSTTIDASEATTDPSDPLLRCKDKDPGTNSVWWSYTAASDVQLLIGGSPDDGLPTVSVHRGTCGALIESACGDPGDDDALPIPIGVAAGETILIEVTNGEGATLDITEPASGTPTMLGGELQANQNVEYDQGGYLQRGTGVCGTGDQFVVVWQDDYFPNGVGSDIIARRYDALGVPLGDQFQVNAYTTWDQYEPIVACQADGDFVVVWSGDGLGTDRNGVHGRRFNADGTPKGDDFVIGDGATSPVALASDASGNFLVAWDDYGGDQAIHGRAFDSSGAAVGPGFEVASGLGLFRGNLNPSASADPLGRFVVAWQGYPEDGHEGIFARRFDVTGAPLGDEFEVNADTDAGRQRYPAVAHDVDGRFVVVWSHYYDVGVRGRHFDANGVPTGGDFTITEYETFRTYLPGVASTGPDDFVVTWNAGVDYSTNMFGQRIGGSGAPVGARFRINTVDLGGDMYGAIAHTGADEFVVAWSSWGLDDSPYGDYGVAAQRFRVGPQITGCTSAPRTDCREPTQLYKGRISIRNKANDGGDSIAWKFTKGEATDVGDFGDPTSDAGFSFCIYDPYERLSSAAVAPAGTCGDGPCWESTGEAGFKYVNSSSNESGLTKLTLKAGIGGKSTVTVKGKGIPLDVPPLPLFTFQLPLIVQLQSASACWSATYETPGVLKNETTAFSAKASVGTP